MGAGLLGTGPNLLKLALAFPRLLVNPANPEAFLTRICGIDVESNDAKEDVACTTELLVRVFSMHGSKAEIMSGSNEDATATYELKYAGNFSIATG